MLGVGFPELVVIFFLALIFIGPKKLPEVAKGLGKAIRDFQNATKNFGDQLHETEETKPKTVADASQQDETKETEEAPEKKDSSHS
jgi:sec-independent protein translocase protein TatA